MALSPATLAVSRQSGATLADLAGALRAVGVREGSGLVLHSSLRDVGKLEDVPIRDHPGRIVETIRQLIGPEGTLCVPAPNWDYGRRREPFDLRHSPVTREIGVVSGHVLTLDGHARSPNPIFSVAAVGKQAREICGGATGSAFGTDSPWERMFRADFANVFLGCGLESLTFARFIEYRFGVPYLYNKLFEVPVLDDGKPIELAITAPLRFMSCPAEYDLSKFESRLRDAGFLREAPLGGSSVKSVAMSDCFALGTACLKQDIHFFLKQRPAYATGQVPIA
jgi:aminoglycoside 3-N-acetyltransferase